MNHLLEFEGFKDFLKHQRNRAMLDLKELKLRLKNIIDGTIPLTIFLSFISIISFLAIKLSSIGNYYGINLDVLYKALKSNFVFSAILTTFIEAIRSLRDRLVSEAKWKEIAENSPSEAKRKIAMVKLEKIKLEKDKIKTKIKREELKIKSAVNKMSATEIEALSNASKKASKDLMKK